MAKLDSKQLCLSLLQADTENEVIALLRDASYWENRDAWRNYGDRITNYNEMGNQMSRPDAALVEKLVNSIDARLMNECLVRGIDPEGVNAPQNMREAVAWFFDQGMNPTSASAGRIKDWTNSKRLEVARGITVAATGATAKNGNPCFTVVDCGEGQTPERMPVTLLSLDKENKLRIPFVQGKFNMGGAGVLRFCGKHNLQFILSRRNPAILGTRNNHPTDNQWGFTVVRRENPEGGRRSSTYTYLAPLQAELSPREGGVLRFEADELPLFPEGRDPYARMTSWGTLIKLYEYSTTGYSGTHILRKDGLLSRIDLLLPDVALPIRFHECRQNYRGHAGSFETSLTGLMVRLEDDRGENLEPDFPSSCPMSTASEHMTATIYAFKKGRANTYRKNEGVIFTQNGQTQGYFTADFFRRKQIVLSYLADSILVIVDCSKFSGRAREDLFMNSRERLAGADLREEIEQVLEDLLKHHAGLRALRERRRREETESALEDAKPLEDILKTLMDRYPSLSSLFLPGTKVSNPFKVTKVKADEKPFTGNRYPTYFKFKDKEPGSELRRDCHLNMRCRIIFDTDAANDYFSRDINPGDFSLFMVDDNSSMPVENYSLNLQNGTATLSFRLPAKSQAGDTLRFIATVTDPSRVTPFENGFRIVVRAEYEPGGGGGPRRPPPDKEPGEEREIPSGIQLPKRKRIYEENWSDYSPAFDQYSALRIKHADTTKDDSGRELEIYDFFINMDNIHLKKYLKLELKNGQEDKIAQTRFDIGLVLVGLSLLYQDEKTSRISSQEEQTESQNIEDRVADITQALAPFLLPMIDALGSLSSADDLVDIHSGEAT